VILISANLQERATTTSTLGLGVILGGNDGTDSLIENLLQTLLCEGRALHVANCLDFTSHILTLLRGDGRKTLLLEGLKLLGVLAKIKLSTDQDGLGGGAVMCDLEK
jgi:hypothetical protein